MRENSHARCGAGEKPEGIECSLRPHSNTKGLPIAIVQSGYSDGVEWLSLSAEPQYPLHRHYPGTGTVDHRGSGRNRGGDDRERQEEPALHRFEAAAPGKGTVRW